MAEKGKSKAKKEDFFHYLKIVIAILFLVMLVVIGFLGFRLGGLIFSEEPMTNTRDTNISYELEVTKGESVLAIGIDLERHGIIESGLAFYIQSRVFDCRIDPGVYRVNSKKSSKDILKDLNQAYLDARKDTSQ